MNVLWLLCLCTTALGLRPAPYDLENFTVHFQNFMTKYSKSYTSEEEITRAQIFRDNLAKINRLNEDTDDAVYDINKFMDLTDEEFSEIHRCLDASPNGFSLGANGDEECKVLTDEDIINANVPPTFDWRKLGAISSVKDQKLCKSCFAFSATGHLEARNFLKYGNLVELSQQQIVDCDTLSGGCAIGGTMEAAFRSLMRLGGSMKATDYPYVAETQSCKSDESKAVVKVLGCYKYNLTSQDKVKQELHTIGPICIGVKSKSLKSYKYGIIKDATCSEGRVDHAVLLVGYGTENDGKDYWLVKNSYGADWGEAGYFKMERGETKTSCGMMNTYMATADVM